MFVSLDLLFKYSVEYNERIQKELIARNEQPQQPIEAKNNYKNNKSNSNINKPVKIQKTNTVVAAKQKKKKNDKKQTRKRMQAKEKQQNQQQNNMLTKQPISTEYQSYRPNTIQSIRQSSTFNNSNMDTNQISKHSTYDYNKNDDYYNHFGSPREYDGDYSRDHTRQSSYDKSNNEIDSERGTFRYSKVDKKDTMHFKNSTLRYERDPREGRQSESHDY